MFMKKSSCLLAGGSMVWILLPALLACSQRQSTDSGGTKSEKPEDSAWEMIDANGAPEERHENAFARAGELFYLIGGRGMKPVDVFDPATGTWERKGTPPLEMHHFQAVEYDGEIYVMGAFTGDYPHEDPVPAIYIYNPGEDAWRKGPEIPAHRRRGAAGVAVYNGKIYLIAGIIDGHYDGHVAWMDEYDPATETWKELPDAPRPRDHFQAAVIGDRLYVAGGRLSSAKTGDTFKLSVPEVDVYDFKAGTWETLPAEQQIPTERAGCTAVEFNGNLLVIGGESGAQEQAHAEVERFDPGTGSWEQLPALKRGRHGTQVIVHEGKLYIAAGSGNRGGGPELSSIEVLKGESF